MLEEVGIITSPIITFYTLVKFCSRSECCTMQVLLLLFFSHIGKVL